MQPRDFVSTMFAYGMLQNCVNRAREEQAWNEWWPPEGREGVWQPWTREVDAEGPPGPLCAGAGAAASEALAALVAAAPELLRSAKPYQLAGALSALRFAEVPCDELLASQLPAVLAAVRRYGDETVLLWGPWNSAFQHLGQLAHAYLPVAWQLSRPLLEDGCPAGRGGGREGAAAMSTDAACMPPPTAEQREAVLAVAGACERLLSRAEELRQERALSRGMTQAGPAFRQLLQLSPKRVSGILRTTAAVAPDAAAPLARAIGLHLLRGHQFKLMTPAQLVSAAVALAAAGLNSASALQGQLYPLIFDTLAPHVSGLSHTLVMRLLGAAGNLSPLPAGLLRVVTLPLRDFVATLTPHQLVHTAAAYGRVPSWAPRPQREGSGGDGGGVSEGAGADGSGEDGAPEHWAWDAGVALPTAWDGGGAGLPGSAPLVLRPVAGAPVQDAVVPQLAVALAQRAAQLGSALVARPSWRMPEGADGKQRLLAFVSSLRSMGLNRPGALALLLEQALDPAGPGGATLADASPEDAAALLAALGDAAVGGHQAGGEEAAAVARVATALAARAGSAATDALPEPQLRALGLQ